MSTRNEIVGYFSEILIFDALKGSDIKSSSDDIPSDSISSSMTISLYKFLFSSISLIMVSRIVYCKILLSMAFLSLEGFLLFLSHLFQISPGIIAVVFIEVQ